MLVVANNALQSIDQLARTGAREALGATGLLKIVGGLSGPFLYGDWLGESREKSPSSGRTALGVPQDAYGRGDRVRLKS